MKRWYLFWNNLYNPSGNDPRDCSFSRSRKGIGISIILKHRASPWFSRQLASPMLADPQGGTLRFLVIETERVVVRENRRTASGERISSVTFRVHLFQHVKRAVFNISEFSILFVAFLVRRFKKIEINTHLIPRESLNEGLINGSREKRIKGSEWKRRCLRFKCFKYLFKQIPTFQTLIIV